MPGLRIRWTKDEDFYVENLFLCECYNATEVSACVCGLGGWVCGHARLCVCARVIPRRACLCRLSHTCMRA